MVTTTMMMFALATPAVAPPNAASLARVAEVWNTTTPPSVGTQWSRAIQETVNGHDQRSVEFAGPGVNFRVVPRVRLDMQQSIDSGQVFSEPQFFSRPQVFQQPQFFSQPQFFQYPQ